MSELNDKLITYGNLSTFYDKLQEQGIGGSTTIESITYAQLKSKRDNGELVKGQRYRITDYVTTTAQENTRSAEHPFDLIVTAVDTDKLSDTGVKVINTSGDTYFVAKPIHYHIDGDSYEGFFSYDGTIEIDNVTYYKWLCDDVISAYATYILTTQQTYTNTPDGEDEDGEYYLTVYPFAGFIYNDDEEEVPVEEYEHWISKKKCIIKTEEIDDTLYLIIGDSFLESTQTYQSQYAPNLAAWEAKYCLDNDTTRFAWAQVEQEGLGFSAIKVSGSKEIEIKRLVCGDEINCIGDDYSGEGHYYIDEGQYYYIYNGTIEDNGTTYYKWYCENYDREDDNYSNILTTQDTYTNSVSGTDGDGCEYYDTVYDIVGSMTIDGEEFTELYKDYKKIIKTEINTEELEGTFLYKRYSAGDTGNTYAWVYVKNSNNKSVNDETVDWDDIDTNDVIYTSSLTPAVDTVVGDYEVAEYNADVQYIPDGKGVIYYLKDEWNNEAEYDFKNMLFKQDFWAIQASDGDSRIYKRYPEGDDVDNGLYAFVFVNGSDEYTIEDVENNPWMWDDIGTTVVIYFYNSIPSNGDYDVNGDFEVVDSKMISLGYKFTFGEVSDEPIDDSLKGGSHNNTIQDEITDEIKYIPILNLGNETVDYGKGTQYEAGDNVQINGNVISATDTKYYAGSNISINGNNQISCTYNYSLPIASTNSLGGIKVGEGLEINNGVLTLSHNLMKSIYDLLPEKEHYLTFEAINNNVNIYFDKDSSNESKTIEISKDLINWTSKTSSYNYDGTLLATLNNGEKLYLRGNNNAYSNGSAHTRFIINNGKCYAYGNIMSLIDSQNFSNTNTLSDNAFKYMFSNVYNNLIMDENHKILLPATILGNSCYENMFLECTSLTTAPDLPATNIGDNCYKEMFNRCSYLTIAPNISATTLGNNCCRGMFLSCTSLTTAPKLPATTLANSCYSSMFLSCTSLTTAPNNMLPAATLANSCYDSMFYGCSSLTTAPELPATTLASYCYQNMFLGCSSLTSAPELPATTLAQQCYYMMFNRCSSLTTSPVLPATDLSGAIGCYYYMFNYCTNLTSITCLATNGINQSNVYDWVENVHSSGTFIKDSNATWPTGDNGIPSGWTVQDYVAPSV